MPKDVTPHQLYKQIDGTDIDTTHESGGLDTIVATNGWEPIVLGIGSGAVVKRTYIDLEGWSAQELTTFVQGVDVQKMRTPLSGTLLANPVVYEYDILSTRRLRLAEMSFFPMAPGFLGAPSDLDLKDVVYAQSRTYAENGTVPGTYITTDTATYGSGNPTAMSRLHWTRLIVFISAAPARLTMYPTNLVIQSVTAKEKDLVWMERLRRSYILQDQADV